MALKIAHPDIDPDYLLREGRALAAIRHPGVVTVHAMGRHHGMAFLVLEHIQGLSLDRMIEDRMSGGEPFPVLEAIDLLLPIADALAVVHQAGLAHRDVKPANVMLAPGGRVVLMDFGLVVPHADRVGNRIVAGSLPYMAPEALTGDVGRRGGLPGGRLRHGDPRVRAAHGRGPVPGAPSVRGLPGQDAGSRRRSCAPWPARTSPTAWTISSPG